MGRLSYLKKDTGWLLFSSTLFFWAIDCRVVYPQVTPAPTVVVDQSHCAAACDNLKYLGCAEANPIDMKEECKVDADCLDPTGKPDPAQVCSAAGGCMVTCVGFCKSTEDTGVWLDPACAEKITSCDQLSDCPAGSPTTGTSCNGSSCKVSPK
jgi:hypothetical protein